jgi:hypothetical protein
MGIRANRPTVLTLLGLAAASAASTGCNPQRRRLYSGPVVQDVRADRATLREISRDPSTRTLELFRDDVPEQRLVDPSLDTHHEFELLHLAPDTRYRYRLLDGAGALVHEASFRTALPPGGGSFRFLAVSDTGEDALDYPALHPLDEVVEGFHGGVPEGNVTAHVLNTGRTSPYRPQAWVAASMLATTPDAALLLEGGDLIGPGRGRGDYTRAFFLPFEPLIDHVPVFPVPGNHDDLAAWHELFRTPGDDPAAGAPPDSYSFDWGDVHFLALNSFADPVPFAPGTARPRSSRATWRPRARPGRSSTCTCRRSARSRATPPTSSGTSSRSSSRGARTSSSAATRTPTSASSRSAG